MPRPPRIRARRGPASDESESAQPNGDGVMLLNSSELRAVNKNRALCGLKPIKIKSVIDVFAKYMQKTRTAIKKYGYRSFSHWVDNMLKHVAEDLDDSWLFVVTKAGDAVAFASCEVMTVKHRKTRHTPAGRKKMNRFIYMSNVCSLEKGYGKKAMELLIKQQISKMRSDGVRGDITVMLNFSPKSEYLPTYYANMGFQPLSKQDNFVLSSYAEAIKDSVHHTVMYKTYACV